MGKEAARVRVTLEVIALSVEDALAAQAGGADRIELIADMPAGGTTPDFRLVDAVKQAVSIPVYVMIRPRGGGFVYSEAEIERMAHDARAASSAGADGIVTGALRPDGTVDVPATTRIVEAAGLPATFHRAIDEARHVVAAVRLLGQIPLVERVLTSGGRASAYDGRAVIAQVCNVSPVEVMAGAGLTLENIAAVVRETGVTAVHVGTAARAGGVAAGAVDLDRVRALRAILDGQSGA